MTVFPYLPSQRSALVWSDSPKVKTKTLGTKMMCDYVIKACINSCKVVWAAQTSAFLLEFLNQSSYLYSRKDFFFFPHHFPKWNFFVFLIGDASSTMPKNDISVSFATTRGVWTTDLQHCNRGLYHVLIKGIQTKVRQRGKAAAWGQVLKRGVDFGTHHIPSMAIPSWSYCCWPSLFVACPFPSLIRKLSQCYGTAFLPSLPAVIHPSNWVKHFGLYFP